MMDSNSENRWYKWLPALECLLNIARALKIELCLSIEGMHPIPDSPKTYSNRGDSRRKVDPLTSVYDFRREELLHRIPGRMMFNGSNDIASLYTLQGKKGINQDAMIVWENFGSRAGTVLCSVFDGHGPYGHIVAKCVRDSLPHKLNEHWEKANSMHSKIRINPTKGTSSSDVEARPFVDAGEGIKPSEWFLTLRESFVNAFKAMDKELRMYTNIDCFCSGTTAVVLVKQGQNLIIGNLGDSRAVLGTRNENGSLTAIQLTVDLKPNLPVEKERIMKCNGHVFALKNEPEVERVWLPTTESPGLSMTRAFGDFCLKDYGVISVPDILCKHICNRDKFVVLATDGIWDVLSNEQVVKIVESCPKRSLAARKVVASAIRVWRYKYPNAKIDDCAVVCLFLDSKGQPHCISESKHDAAAQTKDHLPSWSRLQRCGNAK